MDSAKTSSYRTKLRSSNIFGASVARLLSSLWITFRASSEDGAPARFGQRAGACGGAGVLREDSD